MNENSISNAPSIKHLLLLSTLDNKLLEDFKNYINFKIFPSNTVVVKEGDKERKMYFIVSGDLKIHRSGLDLGVIHSGQHFGELCLISGKPRAATIISKSDVILAELSLENFEKMISEESDLAIHFTQSIISALSGQLLEMTDNFSLLLKQRSHPRRVNVNVNIDGEILKLRTGSSVEDAFNSSNIYNFNNDLIVGALMNNKAVPLNTQIFSDSTLLPLSTSHWEGERIYRRSATFLLFVAAAELYPDLHISLGASVGHSQWIFINGRDGLNYSEIAEKLTNKMKDFISIKTPFNQEIWTLEEAISYFTEQKSLDLVDILKTWDEANINIVNCGSIYTVNFEPLVTHAGIIKDFKIKSFESGIILIAGKTENGDTSESSPYIKLMKNYDLWLKSLGVCTVGKFNRACINGKVSETIQVAEGFHEKNISQIADMIINDPRKPKIICIAGPSSSGKTTFIKRLNVQLMVNGLNPLTISLDDYYVDREKTVKDENGEYDFEALEALDLDNLRNQMASLLKGDIVKTSFYSFQEGKSYPNGGKEFKLDERSILLLEGIHGLNPNLLGSEIDQTKIFKIFIQPMASLAFDNLTRINPSDVRLLRRIIRDRRHRGLAPQDNIMRWPSVRNGEKKHIFPYIGLADAVFDTSLIYEIAVLKVYAERYLLEVPPEHPAYTTAFRLRNLIRLFVSIYPDHVPPTSLIREFIGGSGFEY
ncbi:MAG: cyclic nucleotide-binding domain-containing protein [Candidatus Sericytochromatia bacterium]